MSASGHLVTSPPLSANGFARHWGILIFGTGFILAVATDQSLAPILHSSSPFWAILSFTLLALRRTFNKPSQDWSPFPLPTLPRLAVFFAAHALLTLSALLLTPALGRHAGAMTAAGWTLAFAKISVLLPVVLLYPLSQWHSLARTYAAEAMASVVVLFTFFPNRIIEALWPWYGRILGRAVYSISSLFVPSLHYVPSLYPSVTGPDLDVQILLSCSGMNGLQLFDCLFALVVLCDWCRLNKGRTLVAYWFGLAAILTGNVLRIVSFVVAGNSGLATLVTRFHLPAGSIFFSVVFLVYLAIAYPWMLRASKASEACVPHAAGAVPAASA
jgi:exosortase/archaeosortase family protein